MSPSETHLVNVKSSQLLDHMSGTEQVPKILLNAGFLNVTCQHHLDYLVVVTKADEQQHLRL